MTKNHSIKNPKLKWPKTQAAKMEALQDQQHAIGAVATVGRLMTAANAVPLPLSKKLLTEVAREASKGPNFSKSKKDKKRSWEVHADKYFEENKAWDEVNGIYVASVDLLRTSLALTPLLRERELLVLVSNKSLLTRNIKAITRDTQALSAELVKIRDTHRDKKGGSKDPVEMMDACSVFSVYVNFMERYDSALMPLIVHASEQLQEALSILETKNPELANQLTKNLQQTINGIRTIVHGVTGATETQTPDESTASKETTTESTAAVAA